MPSAMAELSKQIAFVILVCFVSSVWGDEIPPQPVDGKINWLYSYVEGQKLAHETGRPMFVVFRCER